MTVEQIIDQLTQQANPEIAQQSQRFFKTGENEYGAGDKFLGLRVTVLRSTIKHFKQATLNDALILVKSEYHEIRLFAVLLMVSLFERAKKEPESQKIIVNAYLRHTQYINNWDLVDSSAHKILGKYLLDNNRTILYALSQSVCLWERRIAMMATYYFIKRGEFEDTLRIAKILLNDEHDLIHKIVGWMLREVGNKDRDVEEAFLTIHYQNMPRTMLRYAIEKFTKERKQAYLKGEV